MLNKKKPYGEVHGHAAFAFMQDDKYFNAQGYEVTQSGKLIEETPKKVIKEEPKEPVKDARAEMTELVEKMTVDAIKLKLEAFDVKVDKKMVKADLVTMLVDEELAD